MKKKMLNIKLDEQSPDRNNEKYYIFFKFIFDL